MRPNKSQPRHGPCIREAFSYRSHTSEPWRSAVNGASNSLPKKGPLIDEWSPE